MRFQANLVDLDAEMRALRTLGGLDSARVLEIGCGDGRLTLRYAQSARSVLAIDSRAEAIVLASSRLPAELAGRVRFEVGSALELNQAPASFDAALLSHSL